MNISDQNQYSRTDALKYATSYALTPNFNYKYFSIFGKDGGDCANFISQCLRAGGSPMKINLINPWWYNNFNSKNTQNHTWSLSWSLAHSLYWYLKNNYSKGLNGAKGFEVKDIQMLEVGDILFFESNKGNIFHSAIVTSFANNSPLISHHSPEKFNIPFETYGASKLHFLKISI